MKLTVRITMDPAGNKLLIEGRLARHMAEEAAKQDELFRAAANEQMPEAPEISAEPSETDEHAADDEKRRRKLETASIYSIPDELR